MARLAEARMLRHWFIEPFNESELPKIKSVAERALALQPNLPEAHIALGTVYYYGYRQYDEALAEFTRAVELRPNNSQALEYVGYVHRRQGKLELALEELTKRWSRIRETQRSPEIAPTFIFSGENGWKRNRP